MNRFMVIIMKTGFAVLFLAVFAVILALGCAAAFGVPAGIMVSVFGLAVKLFRAEFIVTSLSAETMLFGGLAAAFGRLSAESPPWSLDSSFPGRISGCVSAVMCSWAGSRSDLGVLD